MILQLIIGIIAGIMAGMFGIGGGIVMVPALMTLKGFSITQANGASLTALMMPVGILAVIEYKKKNLIDYKVASFMALGLLLGVYFGSRLALTLPVMLLKQIYGIFLLAVFWKFFDFKTIKRKEIILNTVGNNLIENVVDNESISLLNKMKKRSSIFYLLPLAIIAGILSGMFGIGGGLVIVPIMITLLKFSAKKAVGTSLAALLLPVALPGVLTYYYAGQLEIQSSLIMALGLILGSFAGAKITISLPSPFIKRIYAFFILIIGINFIYTGFNL